MTRNIPNKRMLPKIFVILGPTASGKSDLAVALARKINGEVVSADSRQVYKGLDIGSGKITKTEMRGIPHHLLDIISPIGSSTTKRDKRFSADDFQKLAYKSIDDILSRDKIPIICGGTGFYIQSIVDGIHFPEVPQNKKLRSIIEKLSATALFKKLEKLDPQRAKIIDKNNKPRLIRAIEIALVIGKNKKININPKYDAFQIGINFSQEILKKRIEERLIKRIKMGMLLEAERLHKKGMSWKKMEELGLEYRYMALYLQKKISEEEMIEKIKSESYKYAKRQRTWFKRDKRIWWFEVKNKDAG